MSGDSGERTFDPTSQRREQFRKDGKFARARDAGGIAAALATITILVSARATIATAFAALFARTLGDLGALGRGDGARPMQSALMAFYAVAGPVAVGAAVAATVTGVAQAGINIQLDTIAFKPERLNPLPRFMELFSWKKKSVEVIMSILRIGVVGYLAYRALVRALPRLLALSQTPLDAAVASVTDLTVTVMLTALGGLAVIAVIDYAQSRFSLGKEMMMTRKEVTEDHRSQDGDPKAKGRMRARARAVAKKRALNSVKTADVIIANPTHISVALRYSKRDAAPVVIAKGHDAIAMQIRTEARKHGIPIIENRPLARALDAEVRIGQPVPTSHFAAVARVLAFVYRLKNRHLTVGTARA